MACVVSVNDIVLYALAINDVYYAKVLAIHANQVIDLVYGADPPSQHQVLMVQHSSLLSAANRWACTFEGSDSQPHF